MRGKLKWIIPLLVLILIAVGVSYLYSKKQKQVSVEVYQVKKGNLEISISATTSATIEPVHQADLSFSMSGVIRKIYFREGDQVKNGDVILEMDDRERQAHLRSAQADLTACELKVKQNAFKIKHAEEELNRNRALLAHKLISEKEVADREYELRLLQGDQQNLESSLIQQRSNIEVSNLELSRTRLTAPFNGVVVRISAKEGETIGSSSPVCRLIDESELIIKAAIDEVDALSLKIGQEAKIHVSALPNETFSGSLNRISPVVTSSGDQNRTVEVWVKFTKTDSKIKVGMSADVDIITNRLQDVIYLPIHAVMGDEKTEKYVYVLVNNIIVKKVITTGLSNFENIVVLTGLNPGEAVITSLGGDAIKPGNRVVIGSYYKS